MNQVDKRESGCAIVIFLMFGMLLIVIAWNWIPEIIRKSSTSFEPATSFPVTGTFVSSQYRYDPKETRNSKLIMELISSETDKEQFLLMTYQSDVGSNPIKILFTTEKWNQLLMRDRDESYRFNATLKAKKFINEKNESLGFATNCRLVGKNASLGPALGRRFSTNIACGSSKNTAIMKGNLYRSGGVLCVDLQIKIDSKTYRIEHRPQLMQCLKKLKTNTSS